MTIGAPLAPAIFSGITVLRPPGSPAVLHPDEKPYEFRYVPPRRMMTSPGLKVWVVSALNRFCHGFASVPDPAVDLQLVDSGAT
jgi:hypothetical protein